MLLDRVDVAWVDARRGLLDDFDVGGRLQHIRQFVWRGGQLQFRAGLRGGSHIPDVFYALTAQWPAAVLERPTNAAVDGIVAWRRPVVEGRWVRGSSGYQLHVGIDPAVPSGIYIRGQGCSSCVPFLGRPTAQVRDALHVELTAYVNAFVARCQPVPQAAAVDADRLRRLGLAA